MPEMNINEAAEHIQMSPEDIMFSRKRGLPPGKLAKARNGEIFFDPADLKPPTPLTPKQQLQSQAEDLGIEYDDRTTMAELEDLIAGAEVGDEGGS